MHTARSVAMAAAYVPAGVLALRGLVMLLILFGATLAMLIFGDGLARLIGAGLLVCWMVVGYRGIRSHRRLERP
jgi:hypothetical protein